jgi:hypothetical protein
VTDHPETILWRGLLFNKVESTSRGIVVRYECRELGTATLGAYVEANVHGQWIASFPTGSYAIAGSYDSALTYALEKALDGADYTVRVLEVIRDARRD